MAGKSRTDGTFYPIYGGVESGTTARRRLRPVVGFREGEL